ncbi:MAG: twin-arginine translocation signal domain-containing protein, partial [Gemmatimonadota bacterium]
MTTRRDLLKAAALGCAGLAVPQLLYPARVRAFEAATGMAAGSRHFEVEAVERTTVRVPFRPVPERAMDRELPHWRYAEICQVRLRSGAVGVGETLIYYTWGVTGDEDVARVQGQNAVELLWDDSLGAGLQQALFDAVARTAEVPIHRLLGSQANERTPLSWWNIDMPPEDMAGECQEALRQGYRAYKTKGRPWFDLWEQVAQAARGVPETFKIDMDFNETLLDAARAIP